MPDLNQFLDYTRINMPYYLEITKDTAVKMLLHRIFSYATFIRATRDNFCHVKSLLANIT